MPSRPRNALLSLQSSRPVEIQTLFDALVNVAVQSGLLAMMCKPVADLYSSKGYPKQEEWPDTPEQQAELAHRVRITESLAADLAARGDGSYVGKAGELPWTEAIRSMSSAYLEWCKAIADAVGAVTAAAPLLDGGEKRPTETVSNRMRMDILALGGSCHPIEVGPEGRLLVSPQPKPLTKHFGRLVQRIEKHKASLRVWTEATTPPKNKRRRKRPSMKVPKPLSVIELETIHAVSEHGGNITAAAKALGRDPSTVKENLVRAMTKTQSGSDRRSGSVRAQRLPRDRRGAEQVADDLPDDRE